jgi:hypothetical protein
MICHNLVNILADIFRYLRPLDQFILGFACNMLSNIIYDWIKKRAILNDESKKIPFQGLA